MSFLFGISVSLPITEMLFICVWVFSLCYDTHKEWVLKIHLIVFYVKICVYQK